MDDEVKNGELLLSRWIVTVALNLLCLFSIVVPLWQVRQARHMYEEDLEKRGLEFEVGSCISSVLFLSLPNLASLRQEFLGTPEGFTAFLEFEQREFNTESLYFWSFLSLCVPFADPFSHVFFVASGKRWFSFVPR